MTTITETVYLHYKGDIIDVQASAPLLAILPSAVNVALDELVAEVKLNGLSLIGAVEYAPLVSGDFELWIDYSTDAEAPRAVCRAYEQQDRNAERNLLRTVTKLFFVKEGLDRVRGIVGIKLAEGEEL